jgi:Zn-dependent protease
MQIPPKRLSVDLQVVLDHARSEASQRHGNYVDVEHLLLGLLRQQSGALYRLMQQRGVDTGALYRQIADAVGMERPNPAPVKDLSRQARAALERAVHEADAMGHSTISSGHLLLSLMAEKDGAVYQALHSTALQPEDVRVFLRAQGEQPPASAPVAPSRGPLRRGGRAPADGEPEIILVPYRPARAGRKPSVPSRGRTWLWILAALALLIFYMATALPGNKLFTFLFVFGGWIFSLTLHEFSHALVAYLGGDYTVKQKGYLSFNPLKYTHPMLSIGMPLLFLAMGGIGLPGGAVYIERHRLKSKWWSAAVSAAGPLSNLLLALLLASPFVFGLVKTADIEVGLYVDRYYTGDSQALRQSLGLDHETIWQNSTLWSAVALLVMLEITAVILNLLPIPPLDGFGILEPLLDPRTAAQLAQFGGYGLMLIFVGLWFIGPVNNAFWKAIYDVLKDLHISRAVVDEALRSFMFWRR